MPSDPSNSAWIRLSANYMNDPRIIQAGPNAELIWLRGLSVARQMKTDGLLSKTWMAHVGRDIQNRQRSIHRLLEVGLWEETESGFSIPFDRWSRWQTTQDQIEHQRKLARERQARRRHPQDEW
jgi:hypothetical protein